MSQLTEHNQRYHKRDHVNSGAICAPSGAIVFADALRACAEIIVPARSLATGTSLEWKQSPEPYVEARELR